MTSLGLNENGEMVNALALARAERMAMLFSHARQQENFQLEVYPPLNGHHPVISSITKDGFIDAVRTLKNYRHRPLFAPEFCSPTHKNPWAVYQKLRMENPTPYAAYLNYGEFCVISASRTCLLEMKRGLVKTCPTKGSISRGRSEREDALNKEELLQDSERQASHRFMVADVMSALDKVCEPESINAEAVASVNSDARAHHLVSQVTGKKRSLTHPLDYLLALMPPIAGESGIAPLALKLEGASRNVYTGTIGFIGGDSIAEFNLAFRTIVFKDTIGYLHAGTEIGALTDPEEAYINVGRSAGHIFEVASQ